MMVTFNHNRPPVYEDARMQFRHEVIQFMDNKIDVLIGHTIEFLMDENGHCNASIKEIMRCSKIKKEETVTKSLERIAEKIGLFIEKNRGKRNKYFAPFALGNPEIEPSKAPPLNECTTDKSTPPKRRYFKQEGCPTDTIRVSRGRNKGVPGTPDPITEPILNPIIASGGNGYNNHQRAKTSTPAPPPEEIFLEREIKTIAGWYWLETLEGAHGDKSGPKSEQMRLADDFVKTNMEIYGPDLFKRAVLTTKTKRATNKLSGSPIMYLIKILAGYSQDQKTEDKKMQSQNTDRKSEFTRKLNAIVGTGK